MERGSGFWPSPRLFVFALPDSVFYARQAVYIQSMILYMHQMTIMRIYERFCICKAQNPKPKTPKPPASSLEPASSSQQIPTNYY
jgi:hypothetical protein